MVEGENGMSVGRVVGSSDSVTSHRQNNQVPEKYVPGLQMNPQLLLSLTHWLISKFSDFVIPRRLETSAAVYGLSPVIMVTYV